MPSAHKTTSWYICRIRAVPEIIPAERSGRCVLHQAAKYVVLHCTLYYYTEFYHTHRMANRPMLYMYYYFEAYPHSKPSYISLLR